MFHVIAVIMAPAFIESEHTFPASSPSNELDKATVYLLDTLHSEATKRAQSLFNAILPSDPRHSGWKEKAEYLVIRGSYLTAEDVEA